MSVSPDSIEVVVTCVGNMLPSYIKYTLPFVYDYCRRHEYRLGFVQTPPEDERHPSWQKLLAYHIAHKSTEQVVLIDMDVFILPTAKPIHEVLSPDAVTIMRRDGGYQCGVWGVPRQHRDWMEGIYKDSKWVDGGNWYEQSFVSESLLKGDVPCNDLHHRWNHIVPRRIRTRLLRTHRIQFVHCAGNHLPHRKWGKLRKLFLSYRHHLSRAK